MTSFKDFLKEQFQQDKDLEKDFYKGLEKCRIAIEIATFREREGLTQAELARRVGSSQSAIARMENADYQNYSIRTLRKIAQVLNLELLVSLRTKELSDKPALKSQNIVSLQEYRLKSRFASGCYEFPGPFFKPQKRTIGA